MPKEVKCSLFKDLDPQESYHILGAHTYLIAHITPGVKPLVSKKHPL